MSVRRHRVRFSLFAFQDIITGLCGVLILVVLIMTLDLVNSRENPTSIPEQPTTEESNIEALKREIAQLSKQLEEAKAAARRTIVAIKGAAAPETAKKMLAEMSEKERELAALVSQVEDLRTRVAIAREADARDKKTVREMEETRRILEKRLSALRGKNGITLIPERGFHKVPIYFVCGRGGVEVLRPLEKSAKRKWIPFGRMRDDVSEELSAIDHTTHTVILLVRPSGVDKMDELTRLVKEMGFTYGRDPLEEDVDVSAGDGGDST